MFTIATALIASYNDNPTKTYAGCSVAFLFLFVTLYVVTPTSPDILLLWMICLLHNYSYGGCIDVNQFTIASEIFPSHLRAQGTAIAMSFLFLADTLWLDLAATASARIGWKYYLVFLCLGFVHLVFLYFKLPEVCQKSFYPNVPPDLMSCLDSWCPSWRTGCTLWEGKCRRHW